MLSKGAPAKFTTHSGSWGDGYLIEYETKQPDELKYVSCRHCKFFDDSDNTCNKTGIRLCEVEKTHWKNCKFFLLCNAYSNNPSIRSKVFDARTKYCIEDTEFKFDKQFRTDLIDTHRSWRDIEPKFIQLAKKRYCNSQDTKTLNEFLYYIPSDMREVFIQELQNKYCDSFCDRVEYMLRLIGIDTSAFWDDNKKKHYILKKIRDDIIERIFSNKYNLSDALSCRELFLDSIVQLMKRKRVYKTVFMCIRHIYPLTSGHNFIIQIIIAF